MEVSIIKNAQRLCKVPIGYFILANRGFALCGAFYPYLNLHLTPYFMDGQSQFTTEEVTEDQTKFWIQYTSETNFSRHTDMTYMWDTILRTHFPHLSDVNDWAHCVANLYQPFYLAANNDYFVEEKTKREEESKD